MERLFDIEESMALAHLASSAGDRRTAMICLKEVLVQEPAHVPASYLLAVQHAELGLFGRAIGGLSAVLALDPRIDMARFQLGLLLLDTNRSLEAKTQFAQLGESDDSAMRHYSQAMCAIADGDAALAEEKLLSGLDDQSSGSAALRDLMRRFLGQISPSTMTAETLDKTEDRQLSMGAYGRTTL